MEIENKRHYYFYAHINKSNGKTYVGMTSAHTPEARWKNGKAYSKSSKLFYNAINEFGWDNFEHIILEEGYFTKSEAFVREGYWINKYNSDKIEFGYNMISNISKGLTNYAMEMAAQWKKNNPDRVKERVNKMLDWQKEHKDEMYQYRLKCVNKMLKKRKIPVQCVETNEIYESATEASRKVPGTTQGKICMCCQGKRNTCGSYHWRYANES